MVIITCVKQHPSNIRSSIHEKVRQHEAEVKKAYKKARNFPKLPLVASCLLKHDFKKNLKAK